MRKLLVISFFVVLLMLIVWFFNEPYFRHLMATRETDYIDTRDYPDFTSKEEAKKAWRVIKQAKSEPSIQLGLPTSYKDYLALSRAFGLKWGKYWFHGLNWHIKTNFEKNYGMRENMSQTEGGRQIHKEIFGTSATFFNIVDQLS